MHAIRDCVDQPLSAKALTIASDEVKTLRSQNIFVPENANNIFSLYTPEA